MDSVYRIFATSLVLIVGLLFPNAGSAQLTPEALSNRVSSIVREANLGENVSVVIANAATGSRLHERRGDALMNPASNMKLLTAAAALDVLGPAFRMRTGLYGRIGDGGRVSDLVIRGSGDPSLRMSDLVELASGLPRRGVQRIGRVTVDGSYFDDEILPPLFEQQPNEIASFRAPVSAVAVERASFVLHVLPGTEPGSPAQVSLVAPGYFDLQNRITTTDGGEPRVVAIQSGDGPQLSLRVRGTIPFGNAGLHYRRRVGNPLYHAGHSLAMAVRRAGMRSSGRVRVAHVTQSLPLLAQRHSAPLSQLLCAAGKSSDNFTAEMVYRVLGAERARPGTFDNSALVVREYLERAGADVTSLSIRNGSGLFVGNEITANAVVAVLNHMYNAPGLRPEYLSHLAIGGEDGTLRRRLRDLPQPRIVRAKTGTLNDVIALSGYVIGPGPSSAVSFSILLNGIRGKQGRSRRLADEIVSVIAEYLYPAS